MSENAHDAFEHKWKSDLEIQRLLFTEFHRVVDFASRKKKTGKKVVIKFPRFHNDSFQKALIVYDKAGKDTTQRSFYFGVSKESTAGDTYIPKPSVIGVTTVNEEGGEEHMVFTDGDSPQEVLEDVRFILYRTEIQ